MCFGRRASRVHPTVSSKTKHCYYITKHLYYLCVEFGRKKLNPITKTVLQINYNNFFVMFKVGWLNDLQKDWYMMLRRTLHLPTFYQQKNNLIPKKRHVHRNMLTIILRVNGIHNSHLNSKEGRDDHHQFTLNWAKIPKLRFFAVFSFSSQ